MKAVSDSQRVKLLGKYKTPKFKYGSIVICEVRGEMEIVGLSDGRIPWPIGKSGRHKSLVVYRDLAKAVRCETSLAIRHWWGVGANTASKWRGELNVPQVNDGTLKLKQAHCQTDWSKAARAKAQEKSRDGRKDKTRRKKISEAKKGVKRPPGTMKAAHDANRGLIVSEATRRKQSRTRKKLGIRPPWINEAWSADKDATVKTLSAPEAAEQTGRTLAAVYARRRKLGVLSRTKWKNKAWSDKEDDLVRTLPPAKAAKESGRSLVAVYQRRQKLGNHRHEY